ncbi:MAG: methionine synthase, partial [Candidatus Omnitrophota bacterium]
MNKALTKNFLATAIGSVPFTDPKEACGKILESYKEIPFWPQMPKRAFFENMYVQYMEGFPCAVIDEKKNKVWIDTSKGLMGEIEKTYHKIIEEDLDYFAITEKHAAGFYEFISQAKAFDLKNTAFLKGHITGPISFGLSVTDEKKQSILYNPELSETLVKILAIKARYQIRKLKEIFNNIIIFIDEPYLVSIGSSVVNIKKDDVTTKIEEVVSAIHEEGALAAIHCCGNTDWSILLGLDIDILNFDAYNFLQSISLYPDALKAFLNRG